MIKASDKLNWLFEELTAIDLADNDGKYICAFTDSADICFNTADCIDDLVCLSLKLFEKANKVHKPVFELFDGNDVMVYMVGRE